MTLTRTSRCKGHTVAHAQVMTRYGALFKLLLRLRRVEDSLQGAWSAMRAADRRPVDPQSSHASHTPRWLPLWRLRAQMAHFVGNLQIYLQVDMHFDDATHQTHALSQHVAHGLSADYSILG